MSDRIEYKGNDWRKHRNGGPCPCPMEMEVDVFYRVGSHPGGGRWSSRGESKSGRAGGHDWSCVTVWRPDPDKYECRFQGDRLVAYRRKEAGDAYLRGVQAGLKDAAQTAHSIWQTHNDPKVIADALDSMSRSSAYVSAVSSRVETAR